MAGQRTLDPRMRVRILLPERMTHVSVFTPSHDTKFLDDCYASLRAQTRPDWEWVVVLNNGASWNAPARDDRVNIVNAGDVSKIGALKRRACEVVTGELLIELDHDDMLVSTAIEQIVAAYEVNPDASLIYSQFAQVNEDGNSNDEQFNAAHGWVYDEVEVDGKTLLRPETLHHFPSTVSYIWYAPNHVRAFPRSAYERAGGYDASLDVLDDQDLMSRLYQIGDFVLIPEVLYLQRMHEHNTQRGDEINARIQDETIMLYDRYVEANAIAWSRRNDLLTLDLGGAHNAPPGYTTIDLHDADIVGDVFDVLESLPESSAGVIRASDFLEHIPDKVRLMNAIYRVLTHGGMLLSCTPSSDGRGAY